MGDWGLRGLYQDPQRVSGRTGAETQEPGLSDAPASGLSLSSPRTDPLLLQLSIKGRVGHYVKGKEEWLAQDEGVERSSKQEEEAFLAELEQQGPRPREVHLGLRRQMCSEAPPSPQPPHSHIWLPIDTKRSLVGGTQGTQMRRHDKTVVQGGEESKEGFGVGVGGWGMGWR